jgi:hypothetical protein
MKSFLTLVVAMLSAAGPAVAGDDATAATLRVYQQGAYSPGLVTSLQVALTRLLQDSGFGVVLVDCRRRAECLEPLRHELMLRLVPGRHVLNSRVCGESIPGGGGQPGVLMTVFRGCVSETTTMLRQRAFIGSASSALKFLADVDVLAPIVVHELIHLLLPGELHGEGLAKGLLDENDWDLAARRSLKLESATAIRLKRALAARTGEAVGS